MTDHIIYRSFLIFCTVFFGVPGIWGIVVRKKCTEPVTAKLIATKTYKGNYTPVVRYSYNTVLHETRLIESLSKRSMRPLRSKQTLIVYIDPNKPDRAVLTPRLHSHDFLLPFIAILCLAMSFIPY